MNAQTIGAGEQRLAAPGSADWICLAAAPTFAIMACLTGALSGGPQQMLCTAAHDGLPLNGMVCMYVLMSAFHSAPWLKLILSPRNAAARRSESRHTCHSRRPVTGTYLPCDEQ
jgi:hypothetical protein